MDEYSIKVTGPMYLLHTTEKCWKCGTSRPVIALACKQLKDCRNEAGYENEVFTLSNIKEMPRAVLDYVLARHSHFEKRVSRTAGFQYYVNTCGCGVFFGDFFLHDKPGHGFFPNSEAEAAKIIIERLPLEGTFDFACDYGVGVGSFVFEHGRHMVAA